MQSGKERAATSGEGRREQWRISIGHVSIGHKPGLTRSVNGLLIRVPLLQKGKAGHPRGTCNQSQPGALRQEVQVFLRNTDCPGGQGLACLGTWTLNPEPLTLLQSKTLEKRSSTIYHLPDHPAGAET